MAHKPLISAEEILRGRRARASAGARLLLPGPPPRRAPANARDRKALFKRTRPSPCDEALHEGALADASAGRLTTPRRLSPDDVPPDAAVIPRFGVEQGTRPDGTAKVPRRPPAPLIRGPPPARQVRAVDDCSAAHLNKGTEPQERMKHDTVDALFDACRKLARRVSRAPTPRALCPVQAPLGPLELFKADIDSAFRRIPLRPEHRRFAWVIYCFAGVTWGAQHVALPFGAGPRGPSRPTRRPAARRGAVSSVHNWERIGAALVAICRRLLRIPILRYVDDLFGVERSGEARLALSPPPLPSHPVDPLRARAKAQHALSCVVRVIRCILGPTSVADKKTESGPSLVILGLAISVHRARRVREWGARALCVRCRRPHAKG